MRAFLELAASPQIFHVAILTEFGVFAGNSMCVGKTLFVGCPFGANSALLLPLTVLSEPFSILAFLAFLAFPSEGPASSSSSIVLRFDDPAFFAAGCFATAVFASWAVSFLVSAGGELSESRSTSDPAFAVFEDARLRGFASNIGSVCEGRAEVVCEILRKVSGRCVYAGGVESLFVFRREVMAVSPRRMRQDIN
jgi:hypothetical protein